MPAIRGESAEPSQQSPIPGNRAPIRAIVSHATRPAPQTGHQTHTTRQSRYRLKSHHNATFTGSADPKRRC